MPAHLIVHPSVLSYTGIPCEWGAFLPRTCSSSLIFRLPGADHFNIFDIPVSITPPSPSSSTPPETVRINAWPRTAVTLVAWTRGSTVAKNLNCVFAVRHDVAQPLWSYSTYALLSAVWWSCSSLLSRWWTARRVVVQPTYFATIWWWSRWCGVAWKASTCIWNWSVSSTVTSLTSYGRRPSPHGVRRSTALRFLTHVLLSRDNSWRRNIGLPVLLPYH